MKSKIFILIFFMVLFSCNKEKVYNFKRPKHTQLLGLKGNVKSISYEIFRNEITENGYVPEKRVHPTGIIKLSEFDFIFNNSLNSPFLNNGYDIYYNRASRNFCSIYEFEFNEDGYVKKIIGKNPEAPENNFTEEYFYNSFGITERIIRTINSNRESVDFETNFYYNNSNLLDSIKIYNPILNITYSEKFDNYSFIENKINFSYDGNTQEIILDENSNIKEIKCYANRVIKYNSSGFKNLDIITSEDGEISYKNEIIYNNNNFSINYNLTDKNLNSKFLNFEISRNEFDEIVAIRDLTNSLNEFQNIYFEYERDEFQNWISIKYNFNRDYYDRLFNKIEELKKQMKYIDNYYDYLEIYELLEKYTKNLYISKLMFSQIEVKRTINYYQ